MSARCKLSTIGLLTILMVSVIFFGVNTAFAQTNQADSKLQAANDAINQALNAVLDAESAGANVTDLLAQLNYAMGILAQAENSHRTGQFSIAAVQADNVLPISQLVTSYAQVAKQTALGSSQITFWSSIASTVLGAFVFVLVLFLAWGWFKGRYNKSLFEAKPKVVG